MALSNLHTNYLYGSYESDRDYYVKERENILLLLQGLNLDAHADSNNSIAIGYE